MKSVNIIEESDKVLEILPSEFGCVIYYDYTEECTEIPLSMNEIEKLIEALRRIKEKDKKVHNVRQLREIFKEVRPGRTGDNAFLGFQLLRAYSSTKGFPVITRVDKDLIYGPDISLLINWGLTFEDAERLAKLNWFIHDEYDCLAYYKI